MVEFAQARLAALGKNPCTLKPGWQPGVIDGPTRTSLACYQNLVVEKGVQEQQNSAAIFATDKEGELGRATLTSLWVQGVTPDQVKPGGTTWQTTQVVAAFWWAYNREHSTKDLDRDRVYARQGTDYFTTKKTTPSRYNDNVERYVRLYQEAVGLPATGVVDKATLHMMRGGSVM